MPRLSARGAELHFEDEGSGPALVLLHGLGGSSADWAASAPAFRSRFRVIAPDTRGGFLSRDLDHPQGPFTLAQLAGDVLALLCQLGALPAHLVGWSMGGMVALQAAVDAPDCVRSLTVINSGPDWRPKTPLQRMALGLRGLVTTFVGPGPMATVLAPKLFPSASQAELRQGYIERMRRNDKAAYAALLAAIVGWSVADRLPTLTMPVLVVASDGDYTSVASKQLWVQQLQAARLVVVPGTRHALPLEAPERLCAILDDFLVGLPG